MTTTERSGGSRRPRRKRRHPLRWLAGLAVAVLILMVGVELAQTSLQKILHPEPVVFSTLTAVILALSIGVKLGMFWFNQNLSRRIASAALAATAADSLSDAAGTGILLLGLLAGGWLSLPLDGWLGLGVALFILRTGWGAAKDTVDPLLGRPMDRALAEDIDRLILGHDYILGIHDLVVHDYGPGRRMMSVHAEVPAASGLVEVHHVIDHIERELEERFGLEAVIHLDPVERGDPRLERLRALAEALARELDAAATIHDFRLDEGGQISFDVVVPYDAALSDSEARQILSQKLADQVPDCRPVITVDRSHVL